MGPIRVGDGCPVRIMGILNASPESFYKDSVKRSGRSIRDAARRMEREGADIIDVGGASTAPYLRTAVSEGVETRRVTDAIRAVREVSNLPVSVDTCRSGTARAAMDLGAEILNDVSGLKHDPAMAGVLETYSPSVVLCAFGGAVSRGDPVAQTGRLLGESVRLARRLGVGHDNITLDPTIGFFRRSGHGGPFTRITTDWFERDKRIIRNLKKIKRGHPLLVCVSNKSVIGRLFDIKDPPERVSGSVAVEAVCVLNGADLIRTHNVAQTRQAVGAAEEVLRQLG